MSSEPAKYMAVIFNDRTGPAMVQEIIERVHSFCKYDMYDTVDENGRSAWLLIVECETATPDQLYALIGQNLPDYIRARRFPPTRLEQLRSGAI